MDAKQVRFADKPCTKCGGRRDKIIHALTDPRFHRFCKSCFRKHSRHIRFKYRKQDVNLASLGIRPLPPRKQAVPSIPDGHTEPVYFADLKCAVCGGARDVLRRHHGRMEYLSHCRKCDRERRASRRYWLRSGKRVETEGCIVSEWDMETEYIYNSVKWEPKVRPQVKIMYRRDEISALPCEKMLRILELARKGQVIII